MTDILKQMALTTTATAMAALTTTLAQARPRTRRQTEASTPSELRGQEFPRPAG